MLVGTFQALKHRAAHMFNELELTRSAVYAAASAVDEGGDDDAAIARIARQITGLARPLKLVAG